MVPCSKWMFTNITSVHLIFKHLFNRFLSMANSSAQKNSETPHETNFAPISQDFRGKVSVQPDITCFNPNAKSCQSNLPVTNQHFPFPVEINHNAHRSECPQNGNIGEHQPAFLRHAPHSSVMPPSLTKQSFWFKGPNNKIIPFGCPQMVNVP